MSSQLSLLFARQFGLCGLKKEETVAVIAEIGRKREHVDAAVLAAQQLGAAVILLESPACRIPNFRRIRPMTAGWPLSLRPPASATWSSISPSVA